MGLQELDRYVLLSYGITGAVSLVLCLVWDWEHGLGFGFGGIWSATNFWALKWLLAEFMKKDRSLLKLTVLSQIKVPLLYGIGALTLAYLPMSIGAAIGGFHVPFAVLVIHAILYQPDDSGRTKAEIH